jgi:2-methylisocitrate lyase-like PEP mutase family enzyme
MQKYNINLCRDAARTKSLYSMEYASLDAAEQDAIKMAQALARAGADGILECWVEVQDTCGNVQSIVPVQLVAAKGPAPVPAPGCTAKAA